MLLCLSSNNVDAIYVNQIIVVKLNMIHKTINTVVYIFHTDKNALYSRYVLINYKYQ